MYPSNFRYPSISQQSINYFLSNNCLWNSPNNTQFHLCGYLANNNFYEFQSTLYSGGREPTAVLNNKSFGKWIFHSNTGLLFNNGIRSNLSLRNLLSHPQHFFVFWHRSVMNKNLLLHGGLIKRTSRVPSLLKRQI